MIELASEEFILSFRRPKVLFTDAYLNDPILIDVDERFNVETLLKQFQEITTINRDGGKFGVIDLRNSGSIYYSVQMYSPIYSKTKYFTLIDREFKEF